MYIDVLDLCLLNLLINGFVINLELMKIIIEKESNNKHDWTLVKYLNVFNHNRTQSSCNNFSNSNFLFWVFWTCLTTSIKKDNTNLQKLWHLSVCQKWPPFLTSFMRYKYLLELLKRRSKVQEKNMSCERGLNFDQWKTFSENSRPMRVWLWLVYKFKSLATFLRVHSNSEEASYLSWQNTYPNLKTTCCIKLKFFFWTKLLESLLLAKYLISVAVPLIMIISTLQETLMLKVLK